MKYCVIIREIREVVLVLDAEDPQDVHRQADDIMATEGCDGDYYEVCAPVEIR